MGKKIYAELDKITFDSIKKSRSANGMIDENKFFRGLKEGDSIIFSCNQKKIEAVLKKIKRYNSISEYLKLNAHIGMMEVNSAKPIDFLNKMNDKKVKIYEVDYYPYGDDRDEDNGDGSGGGGGLVGGGWGNNRRSCSNSGDRELENFISALFGGNINNYDDDE
jgi:ASC-1-like (ASCH) protein